MSAQHIAVHSDPSEQLRLFRIEFRWLGERAVVEERLELFQDPHRVVTTTPFSHLCPLVRHTRQHLLAPFVDVDGATQRRPLTSSTLAGPTSPSAGPLWLGRVLHGRRSAPRFAHVDRPRTPPPNRMNCCTHTHPLCTHQALEKKGEDRSLGCLANKVESYPRRAVCVHTAVCQRTPRAAMCVARTGLSHALRGATQDEGMGAPRVCVVRHFARAY